MIKSDALLNLWAPLSATPLVWLFVTICAYLAGARLQRWFSGSAIVSPVLFAIIVVTGIVLLTGTAYDSYFSGAQFINFLLGPATVALAVPLAKNFDLIRRDIKSVGPAMVAGSITSVLSGVLIVWALGGTADVALSIAPKAVTTPIAMAVSDEIGGVPALTAALAILGGIIAAVVGQSILHRLKVRDWRAHGLAAGVAGSGVAAAQVAGRSELAAAFAAVGIALNGLFTAVMVPMLLQFWH
ncbi:hypothetical protein HY78_29935 (plasmid) [Rhizorhabdus wittichii DC-6]|nr:hypothetical protein HY78_29935 [Rhizorhabdus wittichii DC-6]